MRIKIDENLPRSLTDELRSLGHDAHYVEEEGLLGRSDSEAGGTAGYGIAGSAVVVEFGRVRIRRAADQEPT